MRTYLHTQFHAHFHTGVTVLLCVPFLYPLIWLVIGALWPDHQPLASIWLEPSRIRPSLDNFGIALTVVPMARFALNSLQMVLMVVPLTLVVASMTAFAATRLAPAHQSWFVWVSLSALVAPQKVLWIARFIVFKSLGWVNTPWPLVAPALLGGSPFFILVLYGLLRRVPTELWDAAKLDGASLWQLWREIALPATREALTAIAILQFLHVWGDFADPLLYLRWVDQMTLPVGLRLLTELDITRWPIVMAGATVLAIPPLGVFFVGQRFVQNFAIYLE